MGLYGLCMAPEIDKGELDEWDEQRKTAPPFIMHPEATFRKYWDIGSVFLILYSCYTVPYFMALEAFPVGLNVVVDKTVDAMFMFDILLNFITAVIEPTQDGPVLHTKMGVIASFYCKGWFIPDLLSSFPFDAVIEAFIDKDNANPEAARMAKLGRIFRLLKILRMVRIKRLLQKIQYAMGLKNGAVDIVQFLFGICVSAHMVGCLWWVMGDTNLPGSWSRSICFKGGLTPDEWDVFESEVREGTWGEWMFGDAHATTYLVGGSNAYNADAGGCDGTGRDPANRTLFVDEYLAIQGDNYKGPPEFTIEDFVHRMDDDMDHDTPWPFWSDTIVQYFVSFYWAIVTMTTVGYGDYTPSTHHERVFCLYSMVISAIIFAFAMTSICTFIINLNSNEVYKQNRFDEMIGYLSKFKVNLPFQRRSIEYFGYKTGDISNAAFYQSDELASEELRQEVSRIVFDHCHHKFVDEVPIFYSCCLGSNRDDEGFDSGTLFQDICKHLQLQVYGQRDIVCSAGVSGASDMYILSVGKLGISGPNMKDGEVAEGHSIFGTAALFGLKAYPSSVMALDFSDVYTLSNVVFHDVCEQNNLSVLQFEINLKARGTYTGDDETSEHEYLTKYDDWVPNSGAQCTPRLGQHDLQSYSDLANDSVLGGSYASPEGEFEMLQAFSQKQRAYISQLLIASKTGQPIDSAGAADGTSSELD